MAEVELRETIDGDLGTLFEFQADPDASAMAAFPPRDLPAFLEHQGKIKADPFVIDADQQRFRVFDSLATVLRKASRGLSSHRGHGTDP